MKNRLRVLVYLVSGLASLVVLYAAVGFFVVPYLLRAELPALVASELQGTCRVADVRFNPFSGRLEVHGLALDTLDGQPALTADHIVVDLAVGASVKNGYLVADGAADRTAIRISLDAQGSSNWEKLIGETKAEPSPAVPFVVREFSIQNSMLEFKDEGNRVTLNAAGVNADLYDLGPDLSLPARLEWQGSIGGLGKLDGKAAVKLSPVEILSLIHI